MGHPDGRCSFTSRDHKSPIDDWSGDTEEGLDPQRRDYATFATFADPDGNTWNLQEIGFTSGLLPTTNRDGRFSNPKERQ